VLESRRLRELVFLIIGVTTPVGILAVNASAFVMLHLLEFRIFLAASALISSLVLNGLAIYVTIPRLERRLPNLYAEYRRWIVGALVVGVVGWSVWGGYLTYLSMQDARQLPNLAAVLVALWLLLLPFAMAFVGRRLGVGRTQSPSRRRGALRNPD
jgi:hypothetical protein